MKKEILSDAIGMIDEKYTDEAMSFSAEKDTQPLNTVPKTRTRHVRWGVLAACLALVMIAGSVSFAVAAEAREYNAAVEFFNENGLSTSGLTRAEIKEVYRDITTNRFSYGKTADVILRTVAGYDISPDDPTPEELETVWNGNFRFKEREIFENGYDYRTRTVEVYEEKNGQQYYVGTEKVVLECYFDKNLVWQADFHDFLISDAGHTSAGTAVWGKSFNFSSFSSNNKICARLARVDDSGNIMWEKNIDHGFKSENIAAVIDNGDGTWAVVSRGTKNKENLLVLSQFDINGKELSSKRSNVGNFGVGKAVKLGDGYLVQLGNVLGNVRHTARLVKLDRWGNVLDNFTYEEDGVNYYITDMAEFGGKIYLSAYAVAAQSGAGGRDDIANIINSIWENHKDDMNISDEELTPIVRDNYTAVLLVCDTESGEPTTFYSVKSSLGAELQVADGRLEWNVQTIVNAFFSPATSSFSIGGTCMVYKYSFDTSGVLVEQKDTGETVSFRR
ncbi:MAG: hypothetical protein IKI51_04935 [Clostridia bacterium]|nr:hypothetical protein [Clostridia bacterium]